MLDTIIEILKILLPGYLLIGVFLVGYVHFKYDKPILTKRKKIKEIEKTYSKITGLASILKPRMEAELKPLREEIDELGVRRGFFYDKLRIFYPWIRL